MRMRPAVAASFAALASAAVVAATLTAPGTATAITATAARTTPSGVTYLSAPIVQPGGRPTSAKKAKLTGTVKFRPIVEGRPVKIQRRLEGTTTWRTVARKRQNRRGVVSFTGRAYSKGTAFEYRGLAPRWRRNARVPAESQSAAVWGDPVFDDPFSGTDLGDNWQDRVSKARRCVSAGDPRASHVANGTLRLQVRVDPSRKGDVCRIRRGPNRGRYKWYLNGQVSTQHLPIDEGSFTRGTFSARIKFPKQRAKHGGFWLQPKQGQEDMGTAANSGAEIDIAEFFGKGYPKGGLASFLYNYHILDRHGHPVKIGGMQPDATRMLPRRDSWWSRYHVFSLVWTRHSYAFFVDGRQHWRTTRGVSNVDEYLILSLLTSEWELRQAKRMGIRPRGTMYVDWARVWQR